MKSAFTLIELMVVMSIAALIATLTIPSYINFNRSQEVKQAASYIKSNLRDAQNRSFSGEKDVTCGSGNVLAGFFGEFTAGGITFNIKGVCGALNPFPSDSALYTKSLAKNVTINGILDSSSCSLIPGTVSVLFKPIGKGAFFYNTSLPVGLNSPLTISKLAIELKQAAGALYYIIITSGGEIYESTSCN